MCFKLRTVYQAPGGPLPAGYIANLPPDFFNHGGQLIHNARNQIKVFDVNGHKVNVKKYCIPPIINRIFYSYGVRRPKAKTTFANAQEILKRGFHTPAPYGYIIQRNAWGLITYSYFFSEQVTDVLPLGHHRSFEPSLFGAFACFAADLHQKGLLHIDFTPNNILYRQEGGKFSFYLVDINRFSFRNTAWPVHKVLNNLMKPFVFDDLLEDFVNKYAQARTISPDICKKVLRLRHLRNQYDAFKDKLKKLPGAYLFLNQPLSRKK